MKQESIIYVGVSKRQKNTIRSLLTTSTGRKEIIQNRKRNRKEKSEVRVEGKGKGQGFRRKDIGEIMCNSLFKSVLRRDLCQHNGNKMRRIQNNAEKDSDVREKNTEESQRKNVIQYAARASHVRAPRCWESFHYYLSEMIIHLILL